MEEFAHTKSNIRQAMTIKNANRATSRLIESSDRRIVHFIFDPKQQATETEFSKKFQKLIDNNLAAFEKQVEESFNTYVEAISREEDESEREERARWRERR